MTISLSASKPLSGANPRAVDDSIMSELRSLTIVLAEYLVHRKTLEERRATFRTGLAAFIISMGASAAITNSWIAHSHGGKSGPIKPAYYSGPSGMTSCLTGPFVAATLAPISVRGEHGTFQRQFSGHALL